MKDHLMTQFAAASPAFAEMTENLLLGDVWLRDGLAARDRSLVTIAALISNGKAALLALEVKRGLTNGLTAAQIGETLVQLAFYSGWPNAMLAATEIEAVFTAEGVTHDAQPAAATPLEPVAEQKRLDTVAATVAPTAPRLAKDTDVALFEKVWQRGELSARDRSLVTVVALISIGQPEQLTFHVNRALDNGLTEAEAGEVLSHLAYYAGWPRCMSAVGSIRKIIESRTA